MEFFFIVEAEKQIFAAVAYIKELIWDFNNRLRQTMINLSGANSCPFQYSKWTISESKF
jgi:hypothetical protein